MCGLLLFLLGCSQPTQPQPRPSERGRYQMSVFPKADSDTANSAIILDTEKGDVWVWYGVPAPNDELRYVGRATTKIITIDKDGKAVQMPADPNDPLGIRDKARE